MFFNHAAFLSQTVKKQKIFITPLDTFNDYEMMTHNREWMSWLEGKGDTIRLIALDTKIVHGSKGIYHTLVDEKYYFLIITEIIYAEIGDPSTGRR